MQSEIAMRYDIASLKMDWSEGCLPPPSKSMLPLLLHTMTQSKVSLWGSTT